MRMGSTEGTWDFAVAAQLRASGAAIFEYKRREMLAKKKKHLRLFIQGLDINKDSQLDPSEVQYKAQAQ